MNRLFTIAAAAALTFSGMLTASEDIADLQARIATLEAKMMAPAASGDAESLMSLKHKGQVKIGGKVEINLFTKHRDEVNIVNNVRTRPAFGTNAVSKDADTFNYTTYNWEGNLNFQVDINADTKAYIDLDLEKEDNGTAGDLVDTMYIEFKKVFNPKFDVIVGKATMPFGQANEPGISDHLIDRDALIMNDVSGTNTGLAGGNAHANVGYAIGGADTVLEAAGIIGIYNMNDQLKFEFASFMSGSEAVGQAENMHNDKSDKWFGDYAMRVTYTPTEALTTSMSFMNIHEDAQVGTASPWFGGTQKGVNARSLSLAFTYNMEAIKTSFFGEYIANWNMNNTLNQADLFQIGATHALTPKIDISGWWEGMYVDNKSTSSASNSNLVNAMFPDEFNEDVQRFGLAAGYTTASGVVLKAEYIYEYYQNDLDWYEDVDCHQLAFQTVYSF